MLTMPIKREWYNMIWHGKKLEEYRANTPYYAARFAKYAGRIIKVRLRNGYRDWDRTMEVTVRPVLRNGAKPEWGGDPDEVCWVLEILEVKDVTEYGPAQV